MNRQVRPVLLGLTSGALIQHPVFHRGRGCHFPPDNQNLMGNGGTYMDKEKRCNLVTDIAQEVMSHTSNLQVFGLNSMGKLTYSRVFAQILEPCLDVTGVMTSLPV